MFTLRDNFIMRACALSSDDVSNQGNRNHRKIILISVSLLGPLHLYLPTCMMVGAHVLHPRTLAPLTLFPKYVNTKHTLN